MPRVAHGPRFHYGSNGRGMFLTILDVFTLPFYFLKILWRIFGLFMVVAMVTEDSPDLFVCSWWCMYSFGLKLMELVDV